MTEHGILVPTMEGIREENLGEILEVVADKGYEQEEDMVKCLEQGIIPHVILNDGKDAYELETVYEEAEVDLTIKRIKEGDRGICALLSGI